MAGDATSTETAGAALFRIHWERMIEPYRRVPRSDRVGDAVRGRERPDWAHVPDSQRVLWDQAAIDFEAWIRARDDDEGEGEGEG